MITINDVRELLGLDESYERDHDVRESLESIAHQMNTLGYRDCIFSGDYHRVKDVSRKTGSMLIIKSDFVWEIYFLRPLDN